MIRKWSNVAVIASLLATLTALPAQATDSQNQTQVTTSSQQVFPKNVTYGEFLTLLQQAEKKGNETDKLTASAVTLPQGGQASSLLTREDLAKLEGQVVFQGQKVNGNENVFAPKLDGNFDPKGTATLEEANTVLKLVQYQVIDILLLLQREFGLQISNP